MLDESFDHIEISAEYSKIEFEREWMDLNIFMLPNLQIEGELENSWSNGTKLE